MPGFLPKDLTEDRMFALMALGFVGSTGAALGTAIILTVLLL
jgi:hypothetical protein